MARAGIQGFQPSRLAQVLAARRFSQTQLATLVEVSPATISKWRAGTSVPESETLTRLASVANVLPEWFTKPPVEKLSKANFRSNASAHVAARALLEARLEWAHELAIELEQFVDYPRVNVPSFDFVDPEGITSEVIEQAAAACRALWNLGNGPIQDLALAVESGGIVLFREETGIAQIEGLSAWSSVLTRPLIMLSADKDNGYRSRFDLAHECGHICLHRNVARPTETSRYKALEKQAHQFAGALLLPAESFAEEVRTPVSLDDLLMLKRRWGVSVAAMVMRLRSLKLVDDEELLQLFKRRSARWGAKSEPGDGDRAPEIPRLLQRTVLLLEESGVMPRESLSRHIGLSAYDIEMLLSVRPGFLQASDNVVSLSRLRSAPAEATAIRPQDRPTVLPFRQKQRDEVSPPQFGENHDN